MTRHQAEQFAARCTGINPPCAICDEPVCIDPDQCETEYLERQHEADCAAYYGGDMGRDVYERRSR